MGISISDVTPNLKDVYTHKSGAVILDVEPNSPASKAGLKRGDLIFKIDNKNIEDATELKRIVGSYDPTQKITIEYERDKENKSVEVTLANRTTQIASAKNSSLKGLSLSNITNELRYEYRIPSDLKGVLIKDVKPNSKAEEVGLQAGDVIIQIEDSNIKDIKDVKRVFSKYKDKPKRIYINRYGSVLMFVLK